MCHGCVSRGRPSTATADTAVAHETGLCQPWHASPGTFLPPWGDLVEGSIKQSVTKRLKQTGARWKGEQGEPFVELGALAAGPEWQDFWSNN